MRTKRESSESPEKSRVYVYCELCHGLRSRPTRSLTLAVALAAKGIHIMQTQRARHDHFVALLYAAEACLREHLEAVSAQQAHASIETTVDVMHFHHDLADAVPILGSYSHENPQLIALDITLQQIDVIQCFTLKERRECHGTHAHNLRR